MDKKDAIRKNVEALAADNRTGLRAAVSLIPAVGGALDHLVFDRYDDIRMRNIEMAIKAISEQIERMSDAVLVKEWFESSEALNTFKTLIEAIQCEHEAGKIAELSRLFPIVGSVNFADDPLKVSVLAHLSQMTDVSIKLLRVFSQIRPEKKKVGNESLEAVITAVWPDQIVEALKRNPMGQFWKGKLNVSVEMQLLDAKNVVHRVETMVSSEHGFRMTALGQKASEYLNFKA